MSLRVRLVLVVLVLTGVGLVVSGFATSSALRSYLSQRVDDRLTSVEPFAVRRLSEPEFNNNPAFGQSIASGATTPPAGANGDVLAARYDASGHVVRQLVSPFSDTSAVVQAIPTSVLETARGGESNRSDATIAGVPYRVVAEPIEGSSDVAVILAPLGDVDATVSRLHWLEIGVGLSLLIAATGVGLWLVRIGLHPLEDMAATADAIAGGDIDRRVDLRGGSEVEHLANALNKAFDARQESEDKLRRFVTDASHELRTPLTSIRGYSELLRRGALNDPEQGTRAVMRIEDEAVRMGGLVDDLLLLARLDQGRPVTRSPVDISVIAADAVSDARAVDPDRVVSLTAEPEVIVDGDDARLRQVLANLLANTRDHTPADTPVSVTVTATGGAAVVTVTDDGPGLPDGEAAKVFDRFWRADQARGHRHGSVGGSGLGLAIVQAIVMSHGGTVTAGNVNGHGARFSTSFPLAAGTSSQRTPK